MKYIYGPVKSRRLGYSLGISTVPYKVCSFDCVYCQLKKTTEKTLKRRRYIDKNEILAELQLFFQQKAEDLKIDYVTFSGSGEPTLNKSIGSLIKAVGDITSTPVALITNSSTMPDPLVRKELLGLDLIVPSLDAVTQDVFVRIDNPCEGLSIKEIINGLIEFRKEFSGKMWLEVMLAKGLNDSLDYFKEIKKVTDLIVPDKIQLNSPVRPPSLSWVKPVSCQVLKKAKEIFGENCDIV